MTQLVLAFFHSGTMLKEFNRTYIALIPKVANPVLVNDFRPISFCNVLYKIIAKVLVNRLKPVLKFVISIFQNAFVPSRLITDNILLAHETIEFIRKKRRGYSAFALKLDMNKAYDRVKWSTILDVLLELGFRPKWVNLISQCLSTVSFSILVNEVPSDTFVPKCGPR